MVSHAQGIRDCGQRGIYRADTAKEARIDDVEIVQLVGFAMNVED
jgi:hypothetical protein